MDNSDGPTIETAGTFGTIGTELDVHLFNHRLGQRVTLIQ